MSSQNSKGFTPPLPPDQLPSRQNVSAYDYEAKTPEAFINKASFQSVLKHNEDLMARLSVSLRRISHLEKNVEELTTKLNAEKNSTDSLRDELMIHTEKSRLIESETQKLVALNSHKANSIDNLNLQITALKSDIERLKALREEDLEAQREQYIKERHEMNAATEKLVADYEFRISQLELVIAELNKIKEENDTVIRPQFKRIKMLCERQMDKIAELSNLNNDLSARLTVTEQDALADINQLKADKNEMRLEIRQLKRRLLQLLKSDEKYRKSSQEKTFWENKFIDLEAQFKKIQLKAQDENKAFTLEIKTQAEEIRRLKVENFEVKKSWSESRRIEKQAHEKLEATEAQAQSLKYMWQEKAKKIQELESQVAIYESMRQDLSSRIKTVETEVSTKNKKIDELLKLVEKMKEQGSHQNEAILETAIRGMKDLYFEEDALPSTEEASKGISF